MKIGFTGTQENICNDMQYDLLIAVLLELDELAEAHHGDCCGADQSFHWVVEHTQPQAEIHIHPPANDNKRAFCDGHVYYDVKDYLDRNRDIVDACDVLIACPRTMSEELRSGTWATVRYARKVGKPVAILWKDGKYTYNENKSARQSGKTEKDEAKTS